MKTTTAVMMSVFLVLGVFQVDASDWARFRGPNGSGIAAEGAFNVWRMGWGMDYPDAHNIHAEIFHSNVGAPAVIKIPEYDSLIDEAAVEADPIRTQPLS